MGIAVIRLLRSGLLIGLLMGLSLTGCSRDGVETPVATRCEYNPLITPESSPTLGNNINGPSVIRVPDWVEKPLGRYYMYFAHHKGKYIRLAYADDICGNWTVYEPGTLTLRQARGFVGHIASPDVHVDHQQQRITMFFHGPHVGRNWNQVTGVAHSTNGLDFSPERWTVGPAYIRAVDTSSDSLAVARGKGGGLLTQRSPESGVFEEIAAVIPRMRHAAVLKQDEELLVFYSRIGDTPERLLLSRLTPTGKEAENYLVSEPFEVLTPEQGYEGGDLEIRQSVAGAAYEQIGTEAATELVRLRELRDPAVFTEAGNIYLFYSIAAESGIAVAQLNRTGE